MDAQATPQPQGPRNLTPDVAKWLRKMGFTATEHVYPSLTTVEARWAAPDGRQFYVDYEYQSGPQPQATLHMAVYQPGVQHSETLVQRQHVRRLREVRQLVTNDDSYRAARIASLLAVVEAAAADL